MSPGEEREKILRWCGRNVLATEMLMLLGEFSQVLDDLADEDMDRQKREILCLRIVELVFAKLQMNPYWQANVHWLAPMVLNRTIDWSMSNILQRATDDQQRMFGFVKREALDNIIVAVATQIGGARWGLTVAGEVQDFYHVTHREDNFSDWAEAAE